MVTYSWFRTGEGVTNSSEHKCVNVPKAKEKVFYGKEMRSLFVARFGRKLVGHDASGLEARILGHYLNDEELIYELIHGDFHVKFWNPLVDFIDNRDQAKNVEYAYIFGAQDPKLGSMADYRPKGWSDERTGKAMRTIIAKSLPALGELTDKAQRAGKRGYVIGLDGRKLFIRQQHKSLNTLIQGGGAIVMKYSMCFLNRWVEKMGLDVIKVGDFHDESQADVLQEHAELYGNLAVKSIIHTGKYFKLNCPLDAEYKIGNNWSETH